MHKSPRIAYSGNAVYARGGQGEFLRVMVKALETFSGNGTVYSRGAESKAVHCVNVPDASTLIQRWFPCIARVPPFRCRSDLVTLVSDLDFDLAVAERMGDFELFSGVMAQCFDSFKAARQRGAKCVLTCLNTHVDHLDRVVREEAARLGMGQGKVMHPRMVDRAKREIAMADAIHVCSNLAAETFVAQGVPATRVHRLHIGIDLTHFAPIEKRDSVFRVMVISSLTPRKGVLYAMQAFEQANLANSELVIIGGSGDRQSHRMLKEFLTRNANIRQELVDVNVRPTEQHLGRASVLLHAAIEDGFALVVPQALATGRPVIVTAETGASELVQDGLNGFVVRARDVSTMADRLKLLHADHGLLERMSTSTRDSVKHLSYDWHAAELSKIYDQVLRDG